MNLWTPTREWEGQDAFLIGGGPSLAGFDFSLLEGLNVIGCNDAFHLGPSVVKICVFGDGQWWHKNKWKLEKFQGRIVTNSPTVKDFKIPNVLQMERQRDGIGTGSSLGWNFSTGAMAINLAISLGASRVFLLGYDLSNKGTKSHWHEHNSKPIENYSFSRFLQGFGKVKSCLPEGVEVFNITDGTSQLKCFEERSLSELSAVLAAGLKQEVMA